MKMQRIRDLREDNDLKQTDIADYLHISQRTYSHYETDSRSMPIEVLKRLAVYYNTSMDYLAELTDEKKALHKKQRNTSKIKTHCFPLQCVFIFMPLTVSIYSALTSTKYALFLFVIKIFFCVFTR